MTSPTQNSKQYDLVNISFLILSPIVAAIALSWHLYTEGFVWQQWLLALLFYFITGLSITAGYHRLISHRTYKAHPLLETLFLFFGAGAFQNSALKWCTDHRRHHTKCDGEEDPYAITKGFFYAHMGWIFEAERSDQTDRWGKDLKQNPRIMFQHQHFMAIAILSGIVLPTFIGYLLGSALGGFALAAATRIVVVHHATFFINSLCHVLGTQPYGDDNTAKDSFWMAFFTYGEGHHNFHHHFQADYRNGVRWYDFDPTKWLISLCSKIGLASDLLSTDKEDILAARLKMQLKRIKDHSKESWSEQIEERYEVLRSELRAFKQKRKAAQAQRKSTPEHWPKLKSQLKKEQDRLEHLVREWQALLQQPTLLKS